MATRRMLSTASHFLAIPAPTHRLSIPSAARSASTFSRDQPSPPRLPPEQQAEFERLQRRAFERLVEEPEPSSTTVKIASNSTSDTHNNSETKTQGAAAPKEDEEIVAGGVWRGARPEFEGDTNPKTGEVGGPKVEPLRWGDKGDWSYNGRVTDF
jgi:hypothetical protein